MSPAADRWIMGMIIGACGVVGVSLGMLRDAERQREAAAYTIFRCRDDFTAKLFTLDTRKFTNRTWVILGDDTADYPGPDDRTLHLTQPWIDSHCKILEIHQ